MRYAKTKRPWKDKLRIDGLQAIWRMKVVKVGPKKDIYDHLNPTKQYRKIHEFECQLNWEHGIVG